MSMQVIGQPRILPDGRVIPMAAAIRAGDFVFVSGRLPLTENNELAGTTIDEQTRQCLDNIASILDEVGATLADVVKTTIWLVDREDFAGFNRAFGAAFGSHVPSRSVVCAELVLPGALVEIEAVAYKPEPADLPAD